MNGRDYHVPLPFIILVDPRLQDGLKNVAGVPNILRVWKRKDAI